MNELKEVLEQNFQNLKDILKVIDNNIFIGGSGIKNDVLSLMNTLIADYKFKSKIAKTSGEENMYKEYQHKIDLLRWEYI